ncbi:MAG: hypothetical protein FJ087_14145 [Deltaproteobacteria bacterium]|nr:hypothetical protein [Deltaproteobacteria bacterium]
MPASPKPPSRFAPRCTFPYLHGTVLAVNAIPDVALVVDAPSCNFFRAEAVFGRHDTRSTLLDTSSRHRVAVTDLHPDRLVSGTDRRVSALLRRLASDPAFGLVFRAVSPPAALVGTDYEAAEAQAEAATAKPIVGLPDRALVGDWLDGYEDVLVALAKRLPLPPARPDPDPGIAAIVGYRFERNEEDHLGNVRELRRLVEGLGLRVASVWLSGEGLGSLARVAEAGLLLALPGGRRAADEVAARTGATVVTCDLPFGPDATRRFVEQVAAASGRETQAAGFARSETAAWTRAARWVVTRRLVDSRWAISLPPDLARGACEIATTVGADVRFLSTWSARVPEESGRPPAEDGFAWPVPPLAAPRVRDAAAALAPVIRDLDVVVSNTPFDEVVCHAGLRGKIVPFDVPGLPRVELGFPCTRHHALHDEPFLGWRGLLCLLSRIAEFLPERGGG